jgi:type III secretion protein R
MSHHHRLFRISTTALLFSAELLARQEMAWNFDQMGKGFFSDPFYLLFFLIIISLLPFLAVMTTSFAKIVVVLSIARQAIGLSQTPPNIVIMSLALVFTCFSMYPVMMEIYESLPSDFDTTKNASLLLDAASAAKEPIRKFLTKHAKEEDRQLFFNMMAKSDSPLAATVTSSDFIIIAPAFLISELSLAFQIGFLIYLPFLVIDMTVANLLMALGMQMLAPNTISLPFKILLFVLVDGWKLLSEGLTKV